MFTKFSTAVTSHPALKNELDHPFTKERPGSTSPQTNLNHTIDRLANLISMTATTDFSSRDVQSRSLLANLIPGGRQQILVAAISSHAPCRTLCQYRKIRCLLQFVVATDAKDESGAAGGERVASARIMELVRPQAAQDAL